MGAKKSISAGLGFLSALLNDSMIGGQVRATTKNMAFFWFTHKKQSAFGGGFHK